MYSYLPSKPSSPVSRQSLSSQISWRLHLWRLVLQQGGRLAHAGRLGCSLGSLEEREIMRMTVGFHSHGGTPIAGRFIL